MWSDFDHNLLCLIALDVALLYRQLTNATIMTSYLLNTIRIGSRETRRIPTVKQGFPYKEPAVTLATLISGIGVLCHPVTHWEETWSDGSGH